jgi:hypothetical protein
MDALSNKKRFADGKQMSSSTGKVEEIVTLAYMIEDAKKV